MKWTDSCTPTRTDKLLAWVALTILVGAPVKQTETPRVFWDREL